MSYIESINEQNFVLSGESVLESDRLLALPTDEYYANLDTFLRVGEKRKEAIESIKQ